ncbi:hypothetical protein OCD78_21715, partial [Bacillus cereus]|nr:hypothetical protein [Bacillus cereus]
PCYTPRSLSITDKATGVGLLSCFTSPADLLNQSLQGPYGRTFDFSISGCATITSVFIFFHPLYKLFNPLRISMNESHIIEKYVL